MNSQNFPGSLGRKFGGSKFGIILYILTICLYIRMRESKFLDKGYPRKPQPLVLNKQWWFFINISLTTRYFLFNLKIYLKNGFKNDWPSDKRDNFWRKCFFFKNSIDVHSMYNQEQYVFLCFSNNGRMENLHFFFIASSRG